MGGGLASCTLPLPIQLIFIFIISITFHLIRVSNFPSCKGIQQLLEFSHWSSGSWCCDNCNTSLFDAFSSGCLSAYCLPYQPYKLLFFLYIVLFFYTLSFSWSNLSALSFSLHKLPTSAASVTLLQYVPSVLETHRTQSRSEDLRFDPDLACSKSKSVSAL